jgi:hypothetical protein
MQSICVARAWAAEAPNGHHHRIPTPCTMMWENRCTRHRRRRSGRRLSRIRGSRDAQRSSRAVLSRSTVHRAHPEPAVRTTPPIFVDRIARGLPHKQCAHLSTAPLQNCSVGGACQAAVCMCLWPDLPSAPSLMRHHISAEQEHLPRGAVALVDGDCGCTADAAA